MTAHQPWEHTLRSRLQYIRHIYNFRLTKQLVVAVASGKSKSWG